MTGRAPRVLGGVAHGGIWVYLGKEMWIWKGKQKEWFKLLR